MSNDEESKITVSHYTISNIERFFEHFEIKMCDQLRQSVETYKKDPDNYSAEEIEKLRDNVCRGWMNAVEVQKHPLLTDEVFKNLTAKIKERHEAVVLQEMIEQSMTEQAEDVK
jgi:hypothetical protein